MNKDSVKNTSEKSGLHPRNPHRFRYDFKALIASLPELAKFVFHNQFEVESIDFANPEAVKVLNRALLKHFYGISHWDIPPDYLCPPIPGRADYIHYLADLLASANKGNIPTGNKIQVLDIGIGANCVYPIIGSHEYAWKFVGADIDKKAIASAKAIIEANDSLKNTVACRWQTSPANIFKGIIQQDEYFDLTLCNPPFHSSMAEAKAGTERKWKNLGKNNNKVLNFGGQNNELWCEGGEETFIANMIAESTLFANNCLWFTSLISKKTTLPKAYALLKKVKALEVKTIDMAQGQKVSRILAWTFLTKSQQQDWQTKSG
ncbi:MULTISPECIES: 23S rRNA (adenine(1618)-N(6))-methyltransferase RlmF [unclassified Arcicella]|uniref:23S rRNA (adenine(1618)-N(6))-methyltransferase RlmF n=1 Tax=unclassified Arcicella TaxID=2644986 RepID=UPI002855A7F5|nr:MULTISPECIES: 23S rRNA (adenine(1618)-N(6))-methyltransferase RlmF [unclassified Arcicella]MDR6560990.1 23S rRNA (adenine1618-N6)-methyltransferase [Arcicella sp. BE51]MDR6810874.1 23S rRNA (adenine1618-N6)-methyltransferase [Arcicella sp. BE140]MDR6822224.1 23S rRNA (adenine1618-N6)-methyltransferase [Arcicella sp. BE139]